MATLSLDTTTTVEKRHTLRLTKNQLLQLLLDAGQDFGVKPPALSSINVFVRVPGGGDWSNTDLDISEAPVTVQWTETSVTDSPAPRDRDRDSNLLLRDI